ncbi:MAG: hypothetical protein ACK5TQ_00230 [Acetobacteraceae bacterium]|jgi:hypothetical protein
MAAPFGPRFALSAALSAALGGGLPGGVGFRIKLVMMRSAPHC